MIIVILIILFLIGCIISFVYGIVQYFKTPKPPKYLNYKEYYNYYQNKEWLLNEDIAEDEEENELENIHLEERRLLLDETIVKYNKLLDNLDRQLEFTSDDKKRSVILSKQITTLEKLNRALEKLEKLG